ncbi:hypothetical protein N7499_009580, partial [Penicillium canescens]
CQSNCVLHPKPPSGSPTKQALSKVIGYYEAWADRSNCHQTSPRDLPLDALTHLNYAFAYISPGTFKIMTMDAATPVSLFDDVAALKLTNPDLKIYVSIGGWTFSDNNTETQAVFGDIAKSSKNRATFAKNVMAFLDEYGFDGVDLDWEYPGAGDRGGKKEDTDNYVKLMKDLRSKFKDSGRDIGLTFTAPSSYWYMRWFDLSGMLKYADWMNFMTYDLHGVWDSYNPIGSIVQAHTNLTEIKLATELLWRAKVKPSQVVMGFGFYGRAFTLTDPSCTSPGCPFSGGANPGVCTDTSGYLSYYEVQQILAKNYQLKPVHDKTAAVKYLVFNHDQWISYDDKDTFKQKIDWANDIGFGGSLIWASDLDDYSWTAHKALTGNDDIGKEVSLMQADQQKPLIQVVDTYLAGGCHKFSEEVDLENTQAASCSPQLKVGYDTAGCKGKAGSCGKPICCPASSGLKNCQWRGGPAHGDCNGQCHAGEVKVTTSSWGGLPGESGTGRCGRGSKALCCEMGTYDSLLDNCYWSKGVGSTCKNDEESVAYQWDRTGWGTTFKHGNHYCCPKSEPIPLKNCHWVGKGDCADNTCNAEEVTLATDNMGDAFTGCSWYRKKALCCSPNPDAMKTLNCNADLCEDEEDECANETGFIDSSTDGFSSVSKRSYELSDGKVMWSYNRPEIEERAKPNIKPGDPRTMTIYLNTILRSSIFKDLDLRTRAYATGLNVLKGDGASTLPVQGGFALAKDICSATGVQLIKAADLPKKGMHAEHRMEFNMVSQFLKAWLTGILPGGGLMKTPIVDPYKLLRGWHQVYDVSLPLAGVKVTDVVGWAAAVTPNDRIFECFGSLSYRTGMTLLEGPMNLAKMRIFNGHRTMGADKWKDFLADAADGKLHGAKMILGNLQTTIGVWNYMKHEELAKALDETRAQVITEMGYADKYIPDLKGISSAWKEFEPAFYNNIVSISHNYVSNRITEIAAKFPLGGSAGNEAVTKLLYESEELKKALPQISFPLKN